MNSEFYGHTREAVFSSSGDRTRATQARAVAGLSMVSRWGSRAAESLFAVLFPSDCRICGTPRLTIFRLPVCEECLAFMPAIAGCVCSVCGERILSPYPGVRNRRRTTLRTLLPHSASVRQGCSSWQLRRWTALIYLLKYSGIEGSFDCAGAHGGRRHRYSSHGMLSGCQKLSIDALRRAGAEVGYSAN